MQEGGAEGRMGSKYHWSPDPALAGMVGVVTVIIVLIPAVCSVCFHLHLRRTDRTIKLQKVGIYQIVIQRMYLLLVDNLSISDIRR